MNFGSNFNDRKLFTGELKSKTRSIDMNRLDNRIGARSVDEVRMSRLKFKDQLNIDIYGPKKQAKKVEQNINPKSNSTNERQFNHIEAMRNIKRGI